MPVVRTNLCRVERVREAVVLPVFEHRLSLKEARVSASGIRENFFKCQDNVPSDMHYHSLHLTIWSFKFQLPSPNTFELLRNHGDDRIGNEALGQMFVTNQRLDQLAAAQTEKVSQRGMLSGSSCMHHVRQRRD